MDTRRPKGLRVLSGDGIWRRGRNPSPNAQIMILTGYRDFEYAPIGVEPVARPRTHLGFIVTLPFLFFEFLN